MIIDDEKFLRKYFGTTNKIEFTCGKEVNFDTKEITYYNNRIDIPYVGRDSDDNPIISTLTLKSTNDYFTSKSSIDVSLCSIANDMLKIARPIQVSLNIYIYIIIIVIKIFSFKKIKKFVLHIILII